MRNTFSARAGRTGLRCSLRAKAENSRRSSWDELEHDTRALAEWLREQGVGPGDRVAGYLPNCPEAVVALLATASIGAVWAASAPEFGTPSVLDRFRQLEPKVLICVDGYCYGGRDYDRRAEVRELLSALPGVERVIAAARDVSRRRDFRRRQRRCGTT